jgi:hypothetical protein
MKKALVILGLFVSLVGWNSCIKDTAPSGNVAVTCDTSKVSFTTQLLPIINATCMGSSCHSAGSGNNDFTSYVVTKGDIDNVLCRIRAAGTTSCGARMPQGASALPATETALFTKWKADNFCN